MGLDQEDAVIRRRLAQKIEFLTEDLAQAVEPTDQELATYFEENGERYRIPPRLTFSHVYFSVDSRGAEATTAAEALLVTLAAGGLDRSLDELGDRFMLRSRYVGDTTEEIGRLFGGGFADDLAVLPVGSWQGPVESGYGLHLVLVEERTESRLPALEEVRERVRDDLVTARRKAADKALYLGLREGYEIVVGMPADGAEAE